MKFFFLTLLFLFVLITKCNTNRQISHVPNYDRTYILSQFVLTLNEQKKKCFGDNYGNFSIENDYAYGFFVYDLFDTTNYEEPNEKKVDFIENHIYHFSSYDYSLGISCIGFLNEGELIIFKAINCIREGDNINDVIQYIDSVGVNESLSRELLFRLKNYKHYSYFIKYDQYSHPCCEED